MKALLNNTAFVVSTILVSEGVASGELGVNQQELTEKVEYTVAVAEVSTNDNWVKLPNESKVSARDMNKFSARNKHISSQVNQMLQRRLEQKFAHINAASH